MRRVMLLAILALALPTAALANSVTYTTGALSRDIKIEFGTCLAAASCNLKFNGTITNGGSFHVSAFSFKFGNAGTGGTWFYNIGTLTQVPITSNPFCDSF